MPSVETNKLSCCWFSAHLESPRFMQRAERFILISCMQYRLPALFFFLHSPIAIKTEVHRYPGSEQTVGHTAALKLYSLIPGFWLSFHFWTLTISLSFLPVQQCIWKDALHMLSSIYNCFVVEGSLWNTVCLVLFSTQFGQKFSFKMISTWSTNFDNWTHRKLLNFLQPSD